MIQRLILILGIIFTYAFAKAQETTHNFGNVQIHDQGAIGFHGDLINDGDFDDNLGLAGFYNPAQSLTVSGSNQPIFFDMEVDVVNDLNFEVAVGVSNFLEFLNGRILTPRDQINVNLDFTNDGIYNGQDDNRHVDGYVNNDGNLDFTFPIGDDFRLRTLSVLPEDANFTSYTAAYFYENPNSPSTLQGTFNTSIFQNSLSIVSTKEYWDLDGVLPAKVTLTWDAQSDIPVLADDLENLRVVGFSPILNEWINLGNTNFSGTMDTGALTSGILEPDLYSALTIGSILRGNGSITVYTAITPNGDGVNDTLVIEGLETSPDNELFVYNRWGVEVYSKKNYDNSFGGRSDGRVTINKLNELPAGTYYYVLKLKDQSDLAGAFYIQR